MIINLRGTNGAGKSTIVRKVMDTYSHSSELMIDGRRNPIGYRLTHRDGRPPLFVVGHYKIKNGGIDTLPSLDAAYELIKSYDHHGYDVLYEGKNMSDGLQNISQLPQDRVAVIGIDHPLELCVQSVRQRGHRIKEETIAKIAIKVDKNLVMLRQLGYTAFKLDRNEALLTCIELLSRKGESYDQMRNMRTTEETW